MTSQQHPTVTYGGGRSSRIWWAVGILGLLVVLAGVVVVRVTLSQLPPDTTVAGVEVRTPGQVAEVARQLSSRLVDLPVELTTPAGSTTVSAGRLGATLATDDLRAAAEASVGFDAWVARYTGQGPVTLPIDVVVSGTDLSAVAAEVDRDPVDGDVLISAAGVEVVDPVVGVDVTDDVIRDAADPALQQLADLPIAEWPSPLAVEVPAEEIEPLVGQAAVEAAVAEVERLLEAAPMRLTASVVPEDSQTVEEEGPPLREDVELVLSAADLRTLLATEVDETAIRRDRLQVVGSTDAPSPALVSFVDDAAVVPEMEVAVENRSPTPPRTPPAGAAGGTPNGGPADQPRLSDLSGITGDLVASVVTPGLEPDLDATIRAIVRAADRGEDTVEVAGTAVTDADPALLGIIEPVGTYTTFFNPGEGRNTNIRRAAELVDGALIPPGGNYEVNHAVGRRTVEKGFVEGGAILDGEFITDVGGGVSQFATTFFNAMWFGGFDIIRYQPHSFYLDRYPAGREATMDFPNVDLEVNNNTPHWVLIDTESTDDSVTVTFWSTPHFTVTQSIGPRQPVPDANFRITIERRSEGRAVPELDHEATVDTDQFSHTYRAQD
jgi:hypothetical protein